MDSKRALKLYIVLSRAYRAAAEADKKHIREYGLSPSEFAALELLYHKGGQPIQRIAEKVLLTSGSMTYVITQLEQKGHVRRVVCETDRRMIYAELTEAGNALIGGIFPEHELFLSELMQGLPDEDADALTLLLKTLGKSIAGADALPPKEENT